MSKNRIHTCTRIFAALAFTFILLGAACAQAQPVIEAIMHGFTNNPDGFGPTCTPVVGKTDGALYGTTVNGGTNGDGAIWKMNRNGSGYRILHSFTIDDSSATAVLQTHPFVIQGRDNVLYGTTPGNAATGTSNIYGTVFKMNSDGGFYQVLHAFTPTDGGPLSLLQGSDGALYGAGSALFKLNTDGSGYTVLHTLNPGTDGLGAFGALIQGSDGALYGTTDGSGPNSHGTIFKFDTNNIFTVLHSFGSIANDGQQPFCGLVQADNGALYGMTRSGGSNTAGVIFSLNTDGSGYTNLHHFGSFTGDGTRPVFGGLVEGAGGLLYGTTSGGGLNTQGTIFKIGLDGNAYNVLYNFVSGASDSAAPYGGLATGPAIDNTGVFYGTGVLGNVVQGGTVFSLLVNPPVAITPLSNPSGTNGTAVFWPQWAFNYTLQMTTNPASSNWVTVSNAVPVVGVQLTNTPPAAYFRLIYQ